MFLLFILFVCLASETGAKKFRSLPCPKYCSKDISPVCGSDGKIYKNDCERRKINCGDDVDKVDWSECQYNSGLTNCEHHCDKEPDMVCGNDGRTYINLCYLMVENCQKGVELSHYGGCGNGTQTCPDNCVGAERDGPICGSDGNVYKNTCQMKLKTCGQNVVEADLRHCQTTKHCNDKCFRISKLSCGSDGKLYNNGCQMMRKNCGKHVYEVPAPFCLNKLYRTKCPTSCDKENTNKKPVCGSDGQLYASKCELEKMTCGFPLTRYDQILKVPLRNCKDKIQTCSRMKCSREVRYVCGNDGSTYRNMCELQEATCRAGVQLAHVGPCADLQQKDTCPKNCESEAKSVVCASNGNVYSNICEMKKDTCGQKVVVADLDHCQNTKYCNKECEKESSKFVCGSDGNLYRNFCDMKKAHCGKHIFEVPLSQCLSVFQWSGCGRVCPPSLEPVCGSDNKTYLNTCFMEQESCRARSLGGVYRKHYGPCGQEWKKGARNYMYKK